MSEKEINKEIPVEEIKERVKELLIEGKQKEAMDFLESIGWYDDAIDLTYQRNWFYYLEEDGLKEMIKREWEKYKTSLRALSGEVAEITGWSEYYSLCYIAKYLHSLNYKISPSALRYAFNFAISGEIPTELREEAWKCLIEIVKG